MSKFVIGVRGKVPYLIEGPGFIVTDNDDYTLELILDSEWDGFAAKTVVYIYDNGKCILHPIEGNTDTIPVLEHSGRLHIGVTAGEIRTTTWLSIPIKSSVRRKGHMQIPEPEPAVYDQIMEMIRGLPQVTSGEGAPTTGTVGEENDLYVDSKTGCIYHYTNNTWSLVGGTGSGGVNFETGEGLKLEDGVLSLDAHEITNAELQEIINQVNRG